MNKNDYPKAGLQRLFQKGADNFVLLHKNGKAVAFQSNQNGDVNIIDRQTDIDFSSTGPLLTAGTKFFPILLINFNGLSHVILELPLLDDLRVRKNGPVAADV